MAERSLEDALAVLGPEGDMHMQATARLLLAKLALRQRKLRRAARLTRESRAAFRALANEPALVEVLAITAALIAEGGESACAARLLGAAATFAAALESPLRSYEQALANEAQKAARETLGSDGFDAAFAAGQAYELEDALDETLRALKPVRGLEPRAARTDAPSSERCREIRTVRRRLVTAILISLLVGIAAASASAGMPDKYRYTAWMSPGGGQPRHVLFDGDGGTLRFHDASAMKLGPRFRPEQV